MRHCSICRIGKQLHEFESVRGNCWRNECRECRRVQRRQRTRANDDTASIVSGGAVTQASDGDYDMSARAQEERIRVSLRPIEEQLRALTDEHRKGSMPTIGQRLVKLEREMQSRRGAKEMCEFTKPDPLCSILLIVALSTCMFIILRWLESQLASVRQARAEENHRRHT